MSISLKDIKSVSVEEMFKCLKKCKCVLDSKSNVRLQKTVTGFIVISMDADDLGAVEADTSVNVHRYKDTNAFFFKDTAGIDHLLYGFVRLSELYKKNQK
jgi:hypothetical protein